MEREGGQKKAKGFLRVEEMKRKRKNEGAIKNGNDRSLGIVLDGSSFLADLSKSSGARLDFMHPSGLCELFANH